MAVCRGAFKHGRSLCFVFPGSEGLALTALNTVRNRSLALPATQQFWRLSFSKHQQVWWKVLLMKEELSLQWKAEDGQIFTGLAKMIT